MPPGAQGKKVPGITVRGGAWFLATEAYDIFILFLFCGEEGKGEEEEEGRGMPTLYGVFGERQNNGREKGAGMYKNR